MYRFRLESPDPDYPGREVVSACFGDDFTAPPPDLVYGACADGRPVSHVAVYWKTIRVAQSAVEIAGIAQVGTLPEYRGRGLATWLLEAAHDDARHRVAFAALCGPLAFYARLGYRKTNLTSELSLLICPLAGEPDSPIGHVELDGQPW
jgi:predicted N-acetyltransferase YhbS